ncbi:MAG: acetyl-CoA hydrolase/transferase C-terminal domain-containing protein [Mizugakiibacter sp.]|uniref:acetyl-CoA hydrolase/transferase C-terminal domain-containing protein n=1 Tax=Mizugakiibacter sp. TaxID=1972610 RepID=UPI0031BC7A2E|nr:acetyl-CoA hydrolase [Xanthomonadaceae bacterium]
MDECAGSPERLTSPEDCVERILAHAGGELRIAAPLGLGKPVPLLNALYRRAEREPALKLTLFTALSLTRPDAGTGLQARFLGPFLERHFGAHHEDPAWALAERGRRLPANVRVHEFYMQSGALLRSPRAQRDYVSLNYTHVARDLARQGINVIVQLVAVREGADGPRISLSSNPDVTLDLLERIETEGRPRPLRVAVAHPDLPFMGGSAEVPAGTFDLLLEPAGPRQRLFALPREPVDDVEHAIGLHASALVADGGTVQIGIGALSDALVAALLLRHRHNPAYRASLAALDASGGTHTLAASVGGLEPLRRGLYGASEMVMDGFMHLRRAGVLTREVFDDIAIERALAAGVIGRELDAGAAERLHAHGALPARIDAVELARLQRFGMLPREARLRDGEVVLPDGTRVPADLDDASARAALGRAMHGRRLADGRYLRGAFFLGSDDFYAWLRGLEGAERDGLEMTRVSDVNQLYGGRERLDALQRRGARFFNTCMMATLLGAAVSDALEDGHVVSGVGGQYDFVAMAQALPDGRAALLLRATRASGGALRSNILWNYGHTTIPRHLRDLLVTEYGVADLRGKTDEECILATLAVADARFLDALVADAVRAGKLARDFRIPDAWRANTPQRLAAALANGRRRGLFPAFPLGSDFTPVEQRLLPALAWLRAHGAGPRGRLGLLLRALLPGRVDADAAAALERMQLAEPRGLSARLQRHLLLLALRQAARADARGQGG